MSEPDIWNAVTFNDILENVPDGPLPECNRGSWFCPVATETDAIGLDYLCRKHGLSRIYDLGAGTLQLSVEMDRRGYDVVAYESIRPIAEYALGELPDNDVELRVTDYYSDWNAIENDCAAFVALGMQNNVPGTPENGVAVDGMSIPSNS
jgi:hypothetical protein